MTSIPTDLPAFERALEYPFDLACLFQKKKAIRRVLEAKPQTFLDRRIAILGGSTTAEVRDILELFLLKEGIRPAFYESEYNRYFEDVMFDNPALRSFNPQIVYIHTTYRNIQNRLTMTDSLDVFKSKRDAEIKRALSLWQTIRERFGAVIIQNNVELPLTRLLGNLDFSDHRGEVHFVHDLNHALIQAASENPDVLLNDIHYLAASFGLDRWHDPLYWHAYKYALSYDAIPYLAHSVSRLIAASCGKSKKLIVTDLDNTLWGGVIGEDGLDHIQLGHETPLAEAHLEFQTYLKGLHERGILLAIASKNNPEAALEGLRHPDGILKPEDFVSTQANWDTKDRSIETISKETNLGTDSFVFVDDHPAERDWIRSQMPDLSVPDIGTDVTHFAQFLDRGGYFEPWRLSEDDMARSRFYAENQERGKAAKQFSDYEGFLRSLEMTAEIGPFLPLYLDRITQLINKTNQFNLTTRRLTGPEVKAISEDPTYITLYGKLRDRYGDNGLVTVVIARQENDAAHIDLWLMSCRVLKRKMEHGMLQALLAACRQRRIKRLVGYFSPTPKNGMVAQFYTDIGFKPIAPDTNATARWELVVSETAPSEELPMILSNK